MAAPNIVSVNAIYGNSTGKILTTGSQDIVTNTGNLLVKINTIMCSNVTASSQTTTVYYYEQTSSTSFAFIYQVLIPGNSTLDILVRPFYLKENDKITALAGANSSIHLVTSYEILL
jgi:hypothetical protein